MAYTLAGGFVLGSLFNYISASAFVFTGHFGLSASQFSYLFAGNSVAWCWAARSATGCSARGGRPVASC